MRTLELDIRFGNDVRIKKATGVTDHRTKDAMAAMLRLLWDQPEHRQHVIAIAKGRRLLTDLYIAYLRGKLTELPAEGEELLEAAKDAWLATFQVSEAHKEACRSALAKLIGLVKYAPKVSDLPALLLTYRERCVAENHPRAFNYAKQASLAFLRDTLGRRDQLWATVAEVAPMPEAKQGAVALTIAQARAVREQLAALRTDKNATIKEHAAEASRIWWAMCCTGMGPSEYWGVWEVLEDRVRIKGTKRPGRRWGSLGREVPLVASLERPTITKNAFTWIMRKVDATAYQGRHSYATWLEDAEIPRTRRMLYLGHAGKDITDRYEKREITAFLAEDRARLLKMLGPDVALEISRSHGLVLQPMAQEA